MVEPKPETPLIKKIVPARGAAQKAAANLKQQHTRRPRASHVDEEESDAADIDELTNSRGRPNGARASRGKRRGRSANNDRVRRARSPLSSPEFMTRRKRPQISTSTTPSKRAKVDTSSRTFTSQPQDTTFFTEGDMVWVRLDSESDAKDEPMSYWWPAQVIGDEVLQLNVKLFGDDGHGADRLVTIALPSPLTILSFRHEGRTRFSLANFTSTLSDPFETNTHADLVSRWKMAVDHALSRDVDDELPDPVDLLDLTMSAGKRKKVSSESDPMLTPTPSRPHKPPPTPLDHTIKVGKEDGELVLARDHKDRPDHWPARVVGVSQNKTGNWLYEVCFIDGKKKKMDRKWFFSADEKGFATCQMGEWHTEFPASDTEGIDSEDEFRNRDASRSNSPLPSESDLEDIAHFDQLTLSEQMRYVYPFLCRTIRREYQPSMERHDAFMRGGKAREQLAQMGSLRGEFSENEIKKVSGLVRLTMLRDERWAERVYDETDFQEGGATVHASDGMKCDAVIGNVVTPSSDLDAALALAGLKSTEVCSSKPVALVVLARNQASEIFGDSPKPPRSSMGSSRFDQSPDTEMTFDDNKVDQAPSVASDLVGKYEELPKIRAESSRDPPLRAVHSQSSTTQDVPSSSPSGVRVPAVSRRQLRPTGCKEYEDLPRSERLLYCADVLLPEAVLQLHLFRAGHRSSAHLLTPEEEAKLHEQGQEILHTDVNWVIQIVQLRQMAERALKKTDKKKISSETVLLGGTSSRPKMVKCND